MNATIVLLQLRVLLKSLKIDANSSNEADYTEPWGWRSYHHAASEEGNNIQRPPLMLV